MKAAIKLLNLESKNLFTHMNTDLQLHISGYTNFGIILYNDTLETFKKVHRVS
jgi:hypothetical protein